MTCTEAEIRLVCAGLAIGVIVCVFFFQAEDGIRDVAVTGVQTCALPIWNLLMGKYDDRLGYTWIEFGRRDDDGLEHYLTLGCGVRAVSGRGIAGKWFFVTSQRIGRDLRLCSSVGNPLPKDSLVEAVGGAGKLFTTASEYRAEVNRRLFELQPDRYEALIDLLIELRQPQLARQLDEGRLSNALSSALPPVSQRIVSQVAEAMRGLEEDRRTLDNLVAAKRSVEDRKSVV